MAKRFVEWDYKPGEELVLRFKPVELPLMPDTTKEHLRVASKEFLMAMRALVDAAIDYTSHGTEEAAKGKAKTKIEVK